MTREQRTVGALASHCPFHLEGASPFSTEIQSPFGVQLGCTDPLPGTASGLSLTSTTLPPLLYLLHVGRARELTGTGIWVRQVST